MLNALQVIPNKWKPQAPDSECEKSTKRVTVPSNKVSKVERKANVPHTCLMLRSSGKKRARTHTEPVAANRDMDVESGEPKENSEGPPHTAHLGSTAAEPAGQIRDWTGRDVEQQQEQLAYYVTGSEFDPGNLHVGYWLYPSLRLRLFAALLGGAGSGRQHVLQCTVIGGRRLGGDPRDEVLPMKLYVRDARVVVADGSTAPSDTTGYEA
ncbi:hypothetical protein OPT61_g6778 [Boeremia exigua]|uniref:Uncharacterized protein n=1 Tax=Boeremia exigua TaxID=749465 RepID=A0ACC2I5B7_9PLEO|nr:hypothetical protein OPT61_g6778 [Boeremia exigua]